MRIWDLPVKKLCDKHLLGEHRELHCIWTFITTDKGGSYKKHPETLRWVGKLPALYRRHCQQINEMQRRGWTHKSDLDLSKIDNDNLGENFQDKFLCSKKEQIELLKSKGCDCKI